MKTWVIKYDSGATMEISAKNHQAARKFGDEVRQVAKSKDRIASVTLKTSEAEAEAQRAKAAALYKGK